MSALLVTTVLTSGASSAKVPEPTSRPAVAKHSFTVQAASGKVNQLWEGRKSWAGPYADDITFMHPGKGQLVVLVDDHVNEIADRVPAELKPFVTVTYGGLIDAAGSPLSDRGGWTGGNRIVSYDTNPGKICTAGFAWKSWATGAVLGSTARHCYNEDGLGIDWYNDGRLVGTRTQTSDLPSDDVVFLRPAPGTSFNASIWIRTATGGYEERTVTSASVNPVGDTVAFYGSWSGGGIGKITGFGPPLYDAWRYVDTTQVRQGDSGGPVYKTHTNGTVDARGTVSKLTWDDKNGNQKYDEDTETTGMIFVDASYTSSDLKASIYVP